MTRLRGLCTAAGAVTLLLLSGCAQTAGADASSSSAAAGSSAAPGDEDTLMLRLAYTGGFVGADVLSGRMPDTSVYADGRLIFDGGVRTSYPGPALPNVRVFTLSPDELGALIDKAVAAGVENG